MTLPDGINRLVGMGAIRHQTFDESDVAALWNKAVLHAADAKLVGMSLDGATNSGYSAVMEAAMAVLAHYGLRAGNVRNHHEMIFSALDAFDIPGLEDLVADSTKIRSYRKGALYDPDIATQNERALPPSSLCKNCRPLSGTGPSPFARIRWRRSPHHATVA